MRTATRVLVAMLASVVVKLASVVAMLVSVVAMLASVVAMLLLMLLLLTPGVPAALPLPPVGKCWVEFSQPAVQPWAPSLFFFIWLPI